MSIRSIASLAALAAVAAQDPSSPIDIPSHLPTRRLVPDVYGYSIEPIWVDDYISTPLAQTLLGAVARVAGKPPPIRVGGNTADQTYLHDAPLSTGNSSVAIPGYLNARQFNVTPAWYDGWAGYFPEGTDFVYTLNLAANTSAWSNAVAQAEAAHKSLGRRLKQFELGNEIDHFINKGWRDASWDVAAYVEQFRNVTGQIVSSEWYKGIADDGDKPTFQAGVFADPPWVPDQQDEIDDFSIANLTKDGEGGIVEREQDKDIIGSYATHLYPQSTCDGPRWLRMRLDLLSDHQVLWKVSGQPPFLRQSVNISQFVPQVAAADKAGAPLVMGETNSVSCSGKSGISDTFGAALWGVDYVLLGASIGIRKTYFHLGAQSEYSAFTPKPYRIKNETVGAGIRANWYGHYFVAKIVATNSDKDKELSIAALPGANSSSLSGYAVYTGEEEEERSLKKLVFLDMGVWNGTEGLSNNSTLKATDGTSFSNGTRPVSTIKVSTSWTAGQSVSVTRLTGPGTNAKSGVAVSAVTFDVRTGAKVGEEKEEVVEVGENGTVEIKIKRAEGVLLEITDGAVSEEVGSSGAAGKTGALWSGLFVAVMTIGFMLRDLEAKRCVTLPSPAIVCEDDTYSGAQQAHLPAKAHTLAQSLLAIAKSCLGFGDMEPAKSEVAPVVTYMVVLGLDALLGQVPIFRSSKFGDTGEQSICVTVAFFHLDLSGANPARHQYPGVT
ncbi:glycoside hydrolase family 79 protein [Daldinia caldariorum]|uniref:glycoside hydrolase family 79 protein n=1 Tax=Daldinia caldariorum TaxID=326644 RepID=UPI00200808A4|nr:glycoside hydrolase family 79 protein [Daldinia caldariorum]KAI1472848.1 glycoside hydrolase family 79 protein [Daldinia caldariorum]